MEKKFIIKKIKMNEANGSMFIIIDKSSGFEEGSYVRIEEVL